MGVAESNNNRKLSTFSTNFNNSLGTRFLSLFSSVSRILCTSSIIIRRLLKCRRNFCRIAFLICLDPFISASMADFLLI